MANQYGGYESAKEIYIVANGEKTYAIRKENETERKTHN